MISEEYYNLRTSLKKEIDVYTTPASIIRLLERLLEVDKRLGKKIENRNVIVLFSSDINADLQLIRSIDFGGKKKLAFVFRFSALGTNDDHILRYSSLSICMDDKAKDEDEGLEELDEYLYKKGTWSAKAAGLKKERLLRRLGDDQGRFTAAREAVNKKLDRALLRSNKTLPDLFLDLLEEWAQKAAVFRQKATGQASPKGPRKKRSKKRGKKTAQSKRT